GLETSPSVGAGLESEDGRDVGFRSAILQVLSEERPEDIALELHRGVGVESQNAEGAAVVDFLAMVPRAEDEKDLVVGRLFFFERIVEGGRAVDVFLVPEAVDDHSGNLKWLGGKDFVHGLLLPEAVVAGVVEDLAPEAHLFEAVAAAKFAC